MTENVNKYIIYIIKENLHVYVHVTDNGSLLVKNIMLDTIVFNKYNRSCV